MTTTKSGFLPFLLCQTVVLATLATGFAFESPLDLSDPSKLPPAPANAIAYPEQEPQNMRENFQTPPAGYGEVPFWWWSGDRLDKARLEWQLDQLHKKGVAGVQVNYIRNDLGRGSYNNDPPIFSEEWWDFYSYASQVAAKYNMGIGLSTYTLDCPNLPNLFNKIIYNDPEVNARPLRGKQVKTVTPGESFTLTPSANHIAFAAYPMENGRITGKGFKLESKDAQYQIPPSRNSQLATRNSTQYAVWEFTYEVRPGTLNPLHPRSGQRVIDKFFQPFEDHNGGSSAGLNYFFNDLLSIGCHGWQWTDDYAQRFEEVMGYDFFSIAAGLFTNIGDITPKAKMDAMEVQVYLSEERYFKPIFMWHYTRGLTYGCDNNGRGYEPTQYHDYFRVIRWYTAPGHDTPGGSADFIKDKVSASICALYQRPRVWLEGYHSLGWGANPDGLMYATNENFVFGATLLNLHGLYYSTRGGYWEYAPPCYHFRMPYWAHMNVFLKYYERLSYLLSQGTWQAEIAIIYPVAPYAAGLTGNQSEATTMAFDLAKRIYSTNRDVAFIDEQSILRAAIVPPKEGEPAKLSVSNMNFAAVVVPSMQALHWDVLTKLREFQLAGGTVYIYGKKPVISDRAGANDPVLDKLVNDIILTSQERVGSVTADDNAYTEPDAPPRVYPGGFTGYWAWSKEFVRKIQAVGTLKGLSDEPAEYQVKFFADNHGELYVNDKLVCSNDDYQKDWSGTLTLKNGDRVKIIAKDDEGGNRMAGFFFAVSDGKKTLFTTLDLGYKLSDADDVKPLDPTNVHDLHRYGRRNVRLPIQNSKKAAEDKRIFVMPQDVKAVASIKYLHRKAGKYDVYMVMGAEKNSVVSFRCVGRPEIWDPMTGKTSPATVTEIKDGYTSIRIPVASNEAVLFVFDSTQQAQVSAPVKPKEFDVVPINGTWSFKLLPTMDNQWGDFRLPVTADNRVIGAEARRFEYRATGTEGWKSCSYGYGQKFWIKSVPMSAAPTSNPVESLATLDSSWKPYEFSWRWGVPGNLGHQGNHGLKENFSDGFIALGTTKKGTPGHHHYIYVKENPPKRYYLTTSVCGTGRVTIQKGGNLPDAVFLDDVPIPPDAKTIELTGKSQILTLSYSTAGRGFWFLEKGVCEPRQAQPEWDDFTREQKEKAFPNSMSWYVLDKVDFCVAQPTTTEYRFAAPAGLDGLTLTLADAVTTTPRVFVDGKEFPITSTEPVELKTRRWVSSGIGAVKPSTVVVVLPDCPVQGGDAFAEPVAFSTKPGEIDALVDWSEDGTGLQYYSGGAVYEKTITVTKEQAQKKAVLSLGDLCATAEVRINGKSAGVLVCQPWELDVIGFLTEGENRIEIEVYSTLANHYRSIPTNYHGPTYKSGLIGPVELRFER
ncbi:MAG: hypothetical protein IKX40_09855 [Thermoguttaceae bacterium]|nr:hypothetical protein [Thermoguttaceae bacterium]